MVIDAIRELKRRLDIVGASEISREYRTNPGDLYTICRELQQPMAVTSGEYRQLHDCIEALIHKSWDVARAAMPKMIYGITLILEIRDE